MTNEEKARYEELSAKDCLIDDEDVIDYYRLRCEILEERLEQLEKENQELKEQRLSLSLQLQDYRLVKEITLPNVLEENEKLTKVIEILKGHLDLGVYIQLGEYILCANDYAIPPLDKEKGELLSEVLGE